MFEAPSRFPGRRFTLNCPCERLQSRVMLFQNDCHAPRIGLTLQGTPKKCLVLLLIPD
jgi:hypothetical protein